MDLFVLDTVGEQTALEERIVPKLSKQKNPALQLLEPTISQPQQQHRNTQNADHEDDNADDDDDTDDDGDDDDDDDDEDCGDFPPLTYRTGIISAPTAAVAAAATARPSHSPTDAWLLDVERFCGMFVTRTADRRSRGADADIADTIDQSLRHTDVARELRDNGLPSSGKEHVMPRPSEKNKKKLRKLEASKTKGTGWFNMPATELTDEVKRDLELIQMRSVLDPKHFYKKNDLKALPKYFQVGKVLASPLDHYAERGTRTSKKKTIVDELMADAQFQRFNKRKYTEVVEEKKRNGYQKAHSKMKKLKKNK